MILMNRFVLFSLLIAGFAIGWIGAEKHWGDYKDCNRHEIARKLRRVCISYKRSAPFFERGTRLGGLTVVEPETEELDDSVFMSSLLPRRLTRNYQNGNQNSNPKLLKKISNNIPVNELKKKVIAPGKEKKQKSRKQRYAALMETLVQKCCSESCDMDVFIEFEENVRYCQLSHDED